MLKLLGRALLAPCLTPCTIALRSDVQTKVFITSLSEQRGTHEKIVVRELDDYNLLINPKFLELVKAELQKHNDSNTYQPPVADKRI